MIFILSHIGTFSGNSIYQTKVLKETSFWKLVKRLSELLPKLPPLFSLRHTILNIFFNLSSPLDGLLNAENRLLISIFEKSRFGCHFAFRDGNSKRCGGRFLVCYTYSHSQRVLNFVRFVFYHASASCIQCSYRAL